MTPRTLSLLLLAALAAPVQALAGTLVLQVSVKDGRHQVSQATLVDQPLRKKPKASDERPHLKVLATNHHGAVLLEAPMDDEWGPAAALGDDCQPPEGYLLRIPKGEKVAKVQILRPAVAGDPEVLLTYEPSPEPR